MFACLSLSGQVADLTFNISTSTNVLGHDQIDLLRPYYGGFQKKKKCQPIARLPPLPLVWHSNPSAPFVEC